MSHILGLGLTVRLAKTSCFEGCPRRLLYGQGCHGGHLPRRDGFDHDRLNFLLARHVESPVYHGCRRRSKASIHVVVGSWNERKRRGCPYQAGERNEVVLLGILSGSQG